MVELWERETSITARSELGKEKTDNMAVIQGGRGRLVYFMESETIPHYKNGRINGIFDWRNLAKCYVRRLSGEEGKVNTERENITTPDNSKERR